MKHFKILGLALLFLLFAAFSQYFYDINTDYFKKREIFLTLPAGKTVKMLSFGFDDLVADLIYIWSIQFYSDYNLTNSHKYIENVYNLITDISPRYKDPYIIGSVIMAVELNKIKMALRLLQKGAGNLRDEWIFDFDSGYYASKYLKDHKLAEKYFLKASKVKNAPKFISRMLFHQIYMQDKLEEAWKLWNEVLRNSGSEAEIHSARLHLYQIKFEMDKKSIQNYINLFRQRYGFFPNEMKDLVTYGFTDSIPRDFKGASYKYNKKTGKIHPSRGVHVEEIIFVLLGLIFGSFLNVVIYRLPLRKSVVWPGSFCPACGKGVRPADNIPVISYIFLAGKCRNCRKKISLRYPLVEALTAFTFWFTFISFRGFMVHIILSIVFLLIMIALAFIDLKHMILPDELTIGGGILFLIYSFFNPFVPVIEAVLTGGFIFLMFFGIYIFYLKVRKVEGLGQGDIKMVFMMGVFLGAQKLIIAILIASFSGLLVGIFLMIFQKKDLKHALPFGVFLGIGSYISFFWGDLIFNKLQMLYI